MTSNLSRGVESTPSSGRTPPLDSQLIEKEIAFAVSRLLPAMFEDEARDWVIPSMLTLDDIYDAIDALKVVARRLEA